MPGPVSDSYEGPIDRPWKAKGKSIPAGVLGQIAMHYDKQILVLYALDVPNDEQHFVSYGVEADQKIIASELADAIHQWANGPHAPPRTTFEDFSTGPAAQNREVIEKLSAACVAADHALLSLLAVREGITDYVLQNVRTAIAEALALAAGIKP
jgi:hypothetical protein